ncbi:MAG TPA: putative metal-binding motif-containing protein, partial [Polyangiales bacterium]|nr:putative metal-binding motif-containing protein [Polyangiales bacterium]
WPWPTAGFGGVADTGPVYLDRDGDGYNEFNDCNDLNPGVHPGAPDECCDKQDYDCDGSDAPAGTACRCSNPPASFDRDRDGWTGRDGDCNDADASFFPGSPKEQCCDGLDHDCDGRDDPQGASCECANDWDNDGWPAGPWGGRMSDCDDKNPRVNPGALEVCDDGIDNNCDGRVDDGRCTPNDVDGDGFPTLLDCNDFNAGVYPGAPEWCGNGVDDDCDGLDDKRDPNCIEINDHDGDGYPIGFDCNDWDASVFPGNAEYCGDGVDNNCDGIVDPVEICGDRDWDHDGFPVGKDCNDGNSDVFPGSPYERCCDGLDSNCDGNDAPAGVMCGCDTLGDADGDGYGVGFSEPGLADCNDQDPSVYPGAYENCSDGRDNDCDGRIDSQDSNCFSGIE